MSTDDSLQTEDDREQVARFKVLTEEVLPLRARAEGWPIRLDHCFKRICLDHAFADVWYNHLARPAERHLTGIPLRRALACAEEIAAGDLSLLRERDEDSLRFRGKRGRRAPPERRG